MQVSIFDKAAFLHERGCYIGPRDPSRNKAFPGEWMVAESLNVGETQDASEGGFCVVGDDLDSLIAEGYDFFDI